MPQKCAVQPGDSLASIIAELCNKTSEQVAREGLDKLDARLSELPNANAIQVGQRLTISCQDPNEDDDLTRWTAVWLEAVRQARGGKKPLLYGNRSWGNKMTPATTPVAGYPLWLASYAGGEAPAPPGSQPALPSPWSTCSLWQYTQSSRVRGICGAVDMSLAPRGIAHLKLR